MVILRRTHLQRPSECFSVHCRMTMVMQRGCRGKPSNNIYIQSSQLLTSSACDWCLLCLIDCCLDSTFHAQTSDHLVKFTLGMHQAWVLPLLEFIGDVYSHCTQGLTPSSPTRRRVLPLHNRLPSRLIISTEVILFGSCPQWKPPVPDSLHEQVWFTAFSTVRVWKRRLLFSVS